MIRSIQIFSVAVLAFSISLVQAPGLVAQTDQKPKQVAPKKQEEDSQKPEPKSENGKPSAQSSSSKSQEGTRRPRSRPSWSRTNYTKKDPEFIKVFSPVAASMESATVRIELEGEQIALGTVIDSSGLILTKASEIRGGMEIDVNGEKLAPKVVGIHPESDLALLRVKANALNVIQWSDQPTPPIGRWVASPRALPKSKPAIGIISTEKVRPIPPSGAFIGINMDNVKKGVLITNVVEGAPAYSAGLKKGDILTGIDGQSVPNIDKLREALGQYDAGDRIQLSFIREGADKAVKLTLAERDKVSPQSERSNQQNSMGSELSRRRKDFPMAFQHDSMLNSNTCGGPIVDLSGKAIGINIARAGRVSSLALPVSTVLPIIDLLKSGDLAPEIVNESKIESLELELKDVAKLNRNLSRKKSVYSVRYNLAKGRTQEIQKALDNEKARVEALEKLLADSKAQMEETKKRKESVDKQAVKYKTDLDQVRDQLRSNESLLNELEESLEQLKSGSGR